jgi:hypothetical protein
MRYGFERPVYSDSDHFSDDWEMLYFKTLARDGSGDFDLDGSRDFDESIAATDRISATSFLHLTSLDVPENSAVSLSWSAVSGRSYTILFKEDLSAPWQELPGPSPPAEGRLQQWTHLRAHESVFIASKF